MADDIRASVGGWKLTPVTVEAIESRAGEKTFVVAAQRSAFWAGIASAALCLALCHQLSSLCYQTSVVCDYAVDDGGAAATAEGSPLTCEVWRSNLLQPAASWRRNYTVESWRDFRVIAIGRNQDCRFEHPAQLTYPRAMALPFFPELVPQSFMHRMALSGTTWALLVPHTARNAAWADEDDADPAGAAPFDRYYVRDADEGFVLARPYSRRSFRKVEQFWGDLMRHFGREPSEGMRVRPRATPLPTGFRHGYRWIVGIVLVGMFHAVHVIFKNTPVVTWELNATVTQLVRRRRGIAVNEQRPFDVSEGAYGAVCAERKLGRSRVEVFLVHDRVATKRAFLSRFSSQDRAEAFAAVFRDAVAAARAYRPGPDREPTAAQ